MELLDGTIITTALPQMAVSLGTRAVDLHIGISAYLLTLAVFILPGGWAAERYGARPVFTAAIGVHAGLRPVRARGLDGDLRGRAGAARLGRRHDGAGGPAGRAAHHRQAGADAGHRDADLAGADRAAARPAAGRVHRRAPALALHLPDQHPTRPAGHAAGAADGAADRARGPPGVRRGGVRAGRIGHPVRDLGDRRAGRRRSALGRGGGAHGRCGRGRAGPGAAPAPARPAADRSGALVRAHLPPGDGGRHRHAPAHRRPAVPAAAAVPVGARLRPRSMPG